MSYEELEQEAMKRWADMQGFMKRCVEAEDAMHDQDIKAYIEKAVADIARKCGVNQVEVWVEMEYWSRSKT